MSPPFVLASFLAKVESEIETEAYSDAKIAPPFYIAVLSKNLVSVTQIFDKPEMYKAPP